MEDLTGKQLGPYQIVSRFGVGGMATVFKAYQPKMDRYIALKILPRYFSKNPEFIHRFSQEARLIAKLEHPHILPVHDFGESDGYIYLAMRLIEDGSLLNLLQNHGKLELTRINRIISQVGEALDYAHKKGVIHRDFKPSNVLIDKFGNCLLTDFGIAKLVEATSHLTHTGGILGTPAYISPEQGSGKLIDSRSDIYSLGVVLYQMVVGDVPYKADTPMAVIFKHIQEPPPLPRQQVPDLPELVERVILKSLAKNPNDRYSTAAELVNALQSAIAQTAIRIPIDKEPIHDLDPTRVVKETLPYEEEWPAALPVKPRPETFKTKEAEEKKTLLEHKKKVRTRRGWFYGILVIFLLAMFAGAGWLYYDNMFLSESILKVDTNPTRADVYVDGRHVGLSPAQLEELTPGTHKILIKKDRYQDYNEYLFIEKGKPRVIQAKLVPKPFGDLKVNSNPSGAEVIIDDDKRGITPKVIEGLPKGTHRVVIKKEGFAPWQETIEIISLETAQISANLVTLYGGLNISSSPSEADVYIDGKKEGNTPFVLKKVKKGKRKLEIKKAGYDVWKREVYVKVAEVLKIKAVLGVSKDDLKVLSTPNKAEVIINGMSKRKQDRKELERLKLEIERDKIESERKRIEAERKLLEKEKSKYASIIPEVSTPKEIDRDKQFVKYDNGVVLDTKTGLEWYVGPDKNTDWEEAKKWAESLSVAGGSWRMPKINELKTLYKKGAGTRNMTTLLKNVGWWVWSGETKSTGTAWAFNYRNGRMFFDYIPPYNMSSLARSGGRGFAVRSQLKHRENVESAGTKTDLSASFDGSKTKETGRDGMFIAYATGVVYDKSTGLEWYAGPDRDTNWNEAKAWVEGVSVAGGGWRMPTRNEIKTLYQKGAGARNMTPLLKTTGWWVWSGEARIDMSRAYHFCFDYGGYARLDSQDNSKNQRGFAVRPRR